MDTKNFVHFEGRTKYHRTTRPRAICLNYLITAEETAHLRTVFQTRSTGVLGILAFCGLKNSACEGSIETVVVGIGMSRRKFDNHGALFRAILNLQTVARVWIQRWKLE